MVSVYRPKEVFTIEVFDNMGFQMNRLIDSSGMIRAVLSDEALAENYEELDN